MCGARVGTALRAGKVVGLADRTVCSGDVFASGGAVAFRFELLRLHPSVGQRVRAIALCYRRYTTRQSTRNTRAHTTTVNIDLQIISLNQFQQFVRWSGDGDSIQILDVPAFSDKVLPLYFKVRAITRLQTIST